MKKFRTKLITVLTIFALAITAMPMGSITANAATKPAKVTKITKVKATETSLKIKIKKVKKAKGYQVRVTKAGKSKVLKSVRTKNTTVTIKGLTPNTKYKLKVRAYTKSGKKYVYGKEKSISYKTLKKKTATTTPTPTPTPTPVPTPQPTPVPTPEPELPEDYNIKYPGESTNTGDALLADYNAFKAYVVSKVTADMTADKVWGVVLMGMRDDLTYPMAMNTFTYNENYTNILDVYKYRAGTIKSYADLAVDIYNATASVTGRTAERIDEEWRIALENRAFNILYTDETGTRRYIPVYHNTETNNVEITGLIGDSYDSLLAIYREDRRIVTNCPVCNTQMEGTNQIKYFEDGTLDYNSIGMMTYKCPNSDCNAWVMMSAGSVFNSEPHAWDGYGEIEGRPYCIKGNPFEARKAIHTCPYCNHCNIEYENVQAYYHTDLMLKFSPLNEYKGQNTGCINCQKRYWIINPYYHMTEYCDRPETSFLPSVIEYETSIEEPDWESIFGDRYRQEIYLTEYIYTINGCKIHESCGDYSGLMTEYPELGAERRYVNITCPQCNDTFEWRSNLYDLTFERDFWFQSSCGTWVYFENPYYGIVDETTAFDIPEYVTFTGHVVDAKGLYPEDNTEDVTSEEF